MGYLHLSAHNLRELARDYTKFLRFYGKISHEDLIALQKESHALFFIRPSTRANRAGFPTKFVEAYMIGLPIITNSMSDVADFFLDQDVGILVHDCQILDLGMITMLYQHQKKSLRNTFDYNNYLSELEGILD